MTALRLCDPETDSALAAQILPLDIRHTAAPDEGSLPLRRNVPFPRRSVNEHRRRK